MSRKRAVEEWRSVRVGGWKKSRTASTQRMTILNKNWWDKPNGIQWLRMFTNPMVDLSHHHFYGCYKPFANGRFILRSPHIKHRYNPPLKLGYGTPKETLRNIANNSSMELHFEVKTVFFFSPLVVIVFPFGNISGDSICRKWKNRLRPWWSYSFVASVRLKEWMQVYFLLWTTRFRRTWDLDSRISQSLPWRKQWRKPWLRRFWGVLADRRVIRRKTLLSLGAFFQAGRDMDEIWWNLVEGRQHECMRFHVDRRQARRGFQFEVFRPTYHYCLPKYSCTESNLKW